MKWGILAAFTFGIALFFYLDLGRLFTLESLNANKQALTDYTRAHYAATVFLFILIYCAQTALGFPGGTILTVTGGFLFGAVLGTLYVNAGATSGAVLAFLGARHLFRDVLERRFGRRLASIERGFTHNGFHYLLTLRLIPVFPFFLVNAAAGLTRISVTTYTAATAFGIIPASFVYAYAGNQLGTIESIGDIASPGMLAALSLLGLLALVPVIYRKWSGKSVQPSSEPVK